MADVGQEYVGTVKWWSDAKGYGFCRIDGEEVDLFIHFSQVQKEGYKSLQDGERIRFVVADGREGRLQANNVRPLDWKQAL